MIPEQWTYVGPGGREWAFSFAVTALTANSLMASVNMQELLSAERFYSAVPWVGTIHTAAYVVNVAILALVALWVFLSKRQVSFGWVIMALSVIGAILCWAEIGVALRTQPNPVFVLRELPFRPINNLGLAGAQVFLTYLVFKIPDGGMRTWPALVVKASLALCLWLLQLAIWEVVWKRLA
jgi:hypothetical protein